MVVAALYAPTLDDEWHYDDPGHLAWPGVQDLRPEVRAANYRGIVTLYTWALNYRISQDDPGSYHAFNVVVHALNAVLVYVLVGQLAGWFGRTRHRAFVALFAAALFAVHPIATQAVAYVTQRSTSLATLAVLGASCAYVRSRRDHGRTNPWMYAASLVVFALGLHTKHLALILPALLVVTELLRRERLGLGRILLAAAPFFALAALRALQFLPRHLPGAPAIDPSAVLVHEAAKLPPWQYAITQVEVVVRYLGLLVAPVGLSLIHGVEPVTSPWGAGFLASLVVLIALAAVAWRLRRRDPLFTWGIAAFFLGLLPTSSIVPSRDLMFEHRVYLPLVGFATAVAAITTITLRARWWRFGLAAAVVATLAFVTASRLRVWDTELALWRDAVRAAPGSARAHVNVGHALQARGELVFAQAAYERALEIDPDHVFALNNLGNVYRGLGRAEDAERVLLRVLALEPDYAQGHLNLGNAYFARGDVMAARRHYERAADADALRAAALFNLGLCDEQEGRVAEAIAHYEAALERDPNLDAARSRLERLREGGSR